jgi:hypothetical protein
VRDLNKPATIQNPTTQLDPSAGANSTRKAQQLMREQSEYFRELQMIIRATNDLDDDCH